MSVTKHISSSGSDNIGWFIRRISRFPELSLRPFSYRCAVVAGFLCSFLLGSPSIYIKLVTTRGNTRYKSRNNWNSFWLAGSFIVVMAAALFFFVVFSWPGLTKCLRQLIFQTKNERLLVWVSSSPPPVVTGLLANTQCISWRSPERWLCRHDSRVLTSIWLIRVSCLLLSTWCLVCLQVLITFVGTITVQNRFWMLSFFSFSSPFQSSSRSSCLI